MDAQSMKQALAQISNLIVQNSDLLSEIDGQMGGGKLGATMSSGFSSVLSVLTDENTDDIGQLMNAAASGLSASAPSTMSSIMSLMMSGMGAQMQGKTEVSLDELAHAMQAGNQRIMDEKGSKPGEKTVLDALVPAVTALLSNVKAGEREAFLSAGQAAAQGAENTRDMRAVHGSAAKNADASVGKLDAGAVVGKMFFEGFAKAFQ